MASLLDDKPFMIELNGLHFGPSMKVVGFKIFVASKLFIWEGQVLKLTLFVDIKLGKYTSKFIFYK